MPLIAYNPNQARRQGLMPPALNQLSVKVPGSGHGITFYPGDFGESGSNLVTPEDWDKIKDLPAIKRRLETGLMYVVASPTGKEDPSKSTPSITSFTLPQATNMIEACTNMDVLKIWRDEDDRKGVQSAIAKQIGKFSPEGTKL